MKDRSLVAPFHDSMSERALECAGELAEIGIDSVLDEGLLKEIPLISTAISIYNIGNTIRERYHVLKLAAFLDEIRRGTADENIRRQYRERFQKEEAFRNQELEYILLITDRYIETDKARILAKLYLAYLWGTITWDRFALFAAALERLMEIDLEVLQSSACNYAPVSVSREDVLGRLAAVGFLVLDIRNMPVKTAYGHGYTTGVDGYAVSSVGQVFRQILKTEY